MASFLSATATEAYTLSRNAYRLSACDKVLLPMNRTPNPEHRIVIESHHLVLLSVAEGVLDDLFNEHRNGIICS